jgi:hypothetical protein
MWWLALRKLLLVLRMTVWLVQRTTLLLALRTMWWRALRKLVLAKRTFAQRMT